MRLGWIAVGSAVLLTTAAASAAEPKAKEAQILFANNGGIRDWRALDDKGLYVRGQDGQWYYATLFASCFGLATATGIGFITTPGGGFDKFSAIAVENSKCPVVSLVKTDPPPKK